MTWLKFKSDSSQTKWPSLMRIMLGRLVIIIAIFIILTVMLPRDEGAFYTIIALAFVINIPYALWLRRDVTARCSAPLQFLVDILIVTGIVHYTGGLASDLFLLYPLIILSAGIVVSGQHALKIAILSIVAYSTLVILELQGILTNHGPQPGVYEDSTKALQILSLRIFLFVFFSGASHYLSSRCTFQAKQFHRYQEWAITIFDNVSIGIIALSSENRVIFANLAAAKLLHWPQQSLTDQNFAILFDGEAPLKLEREQEQDRVWYMKRKNVGAFPVAFSASRTKLLVNPENDLGFLQDPVEQEVTIFAFRDITQELELEATRTKMDGMTIAFNVGFEIGDSIRNPLTAIECGGEGIAKIVRSLREKKEIPSSVDLADTEMMANIITNSVNDIAKNIDRLLVHSTKNPAQVVKMAAAAAEQFCPRDTDSKPTSAEIPRRASNHAKNHLPPPNVSA